MKQVIWAVTTLCISGLILGGAGCVPEGIEELKAELSQQLDQPGESFPEGLDQSFEMMGLSSARKAKICGLVQGLKAQMAPLKEARHAMKAAMAEAVEAGVLDREILQGQLQVLASTFQELRPVMADFFDQLHSNLDADQRQLFAGSAAAQGSAEDGECAEEGAEGQAHEGISSKQGKKGKMNKIFQELGLSRDQKMSIMVALRDRFLYQSDDQGDRLKQMGQRMSEARGAFRSQNFEAARWAGEQEVGPYLQDRVGRMLQVIEIVLPQLTPEQRVAWAGLIREKADAGKGGKGNAFCEGVKPEVLSGAEALKSKSCQQQGDKDCGQQGHKKCGQQGDKDCGQQSDKGSQGSCHQGKGENNNSAENGNAPIN